MFSSFPVRPGQTERSIPPAPLDKRQRRASVACTNCRSRKSRCIPMPDDRHKEDKYREKPCTRCAKKNLVCEYLPVSVELESRRASHSLSPPYPGASDFTDTTPQSSFSGIVARNPQSDLGGGFDWPPSQYHAPPPYDGQVAGSPNPEYLHDQPTNFGQWTDQPSDWSSYTIPNGVLHPFSTSFDVNVPSHSWMGNHHDLQLADAYAQEPHQGAAIDTTDRSMTTWPAHGRAETAFGSYFGF